MSVLDQPTVWAALDPRSMRSLLESFPEQVQNAAEAGRKVNLPVPGKIRAIVVAGLGGSAIGGDLVRSIAESQLQYPLSIDL
jgi:glucose/mannose-6-phosphate isomerase